MFLKKEDSTRNKTGSIKQFKNQLTYETEKWVWSLEWDFPLKSSQGRPLESSVPTSK